MSARRVRALEVLDARREAIAGRVARDIGDRLASDASPVGLVRAALRAGAVLDGEAARVRSLGSTTACSAGCSFCCHVHVEVTRAEVLAIVAFVEALDAGDRAPLRERIEARVAEAASMTHEERWARRIPCALLASDGTCAVYAARPLRCRAFHSADRARCERSFEGGSEEAPATIPALDRVHDAVEEGFERALDARGLVEPPLLLEPALLAALSR